jgi:hypothetical protein
MYNPEFTDGHQLANKVYAEFNMFSSLMVNWVCREIHHTDVVTVNNRHLLRLNVELPEEVPQPPALRSGVSYTTVFGFGTRM